MEVNREGRVPGDSKGRSTPLGRPTRETGGSVLGGYSEDQPGGQQAVCWVGTAREDQPGGQEAVCWVGTAREDQPGGSVLGDRQCGGNINTNTSFFFFFQGSVLGGYSEGGPTRGAGGRVLGRYSEGGPTRSRDRRQHAGSVQRERSNQGG